MSVSCVSVNVCVCKVKTGRHSCTSSIGLELSGCQSKASPHPLPLLFFCPLSLVPYPSALAGVTWWHHPVLLPFFPCLSSKASSLSQSPACIHAPASAMALASDDFQIFALQVTSLLTEPSSEF